MSEFLHEGMHPGEWLVSDSGTRARDEITVTVAADTAMVTGTVLGKITASGKYIKSLNAAADGSQVAAAILLYDIPAGAARDVKVAAYTRDCEVWGAKLNNGVALETNVVAELDARGIVVR